MKYLILLTPLVFLVSCATNNYQEMYKKGAAYAYSNREAEAIPLLTKACDGNIAKACELRGVFEKKMYKSLEFLKKGCILGEKHSCESMKLALKSGLEHYQKDCEKKLQDGCSIQEGLELAKYEEFAENEASAQILYDQLCEKGSGIACYQRSTYEMTEQLINIEEAKKFLTKACDLNEVFSCFRLGELFFQSNFSKSTIYYQKACAKGIQPACRRIKGISIQDSTADSIEAACQAGLFGFDCKTVSQK